MNLDALDAVLTSHRYYAKKAWHWSSGMNTQIRCQAKKKGLKDSSLSGKPYLLDRC